MRCGSGAVVFAILAWRCGSGAVARFPNDGGAAAADFPPPWTSLLRTLFHTNDCSKSHESAKRNSRTHSHPQFFFATCLTTHIHLFSSSFHVFIRELFGYCLPSTERNELVNVIDTVLA